MDAKDRNQEVAVAIPIVQVDPEADVKIQPSNGCPSNDPAGLQQHYTAGDFPGNESITNVGTNSPTPKTPLTAREPEGDYDEGEIYKKTESQKETYRRLRVQVLIEWIGALGILGCFIASFSAKELRKIVIWDLQFWKWCLLLNVIFCGILVANWFMHVVVFLNRRNFIQRMKDLPFVHRLNRSLQVFIWLGLVLLAWASLFNHGAERTNASKKILNLVTWTLVAILVGSFLWLLKNLLLEMLESKFRVDTYADRIQECLFSEYVVKKLSGPPLMEMAETVGSPIRRNKMSKDINDKTIIDVEKLYKMDKVGISGSILKVLVDHITGSGPSMSSALNDESDNGERRGSDQEKTTANAEKIVITSESGAREAAHCIFENVAKPGYMYIEEEDLLRFLTKEEVDVLFPLLDGFETRKITKISTRNWVVNAYRDRRALAITLYDTRRAVTKLNKIMSWILVVLSIIVWLLLMEITTSETIAIFLTAAAFAFGNTFKTIFEAAVFIFGAHPFDVGDRCVVDGIPLVVEEIDILTTIFLKSNNEKIYYPNSVLASKPISNYYRSPDMGESLEFSIAFETPLEGIEALKAKIKNYLESTPQHWHRDHGIVMTEKENDNNLKMSVNCRHRTNFQDLYERYRRRSELVIEMKKIFEELGIQCSMAKQ